MSRRTIRRRTALLLCLGGSLAVGSAEPQPAAPAHAAKPAVSREFVARYCADCHGRDEKSGGLDLETLTAQDLGRHTEAWEKVVRKLRARQMPPPDAERPSEAEFDAAFSSLETSLDRLAAERPRPGRTETFRRLNRTEYHNAVRDLLGLDVDVAALLPADESSHGFDNVTVADLSPTLLSRYVSAAQKISRLAVGRPQRSPGGETVRVRADVTQDAHLDGLPLGTRGGTVFPYNFPQDGEYEVQVHLMRDRNEDVEGLNGPHDLEILLDRERVGLFTVAPRKNDQTQASVDADLKVRFKATAGEHQVAATFLSKSGSLLESTRQPLHVHFNFYRHPRLGPAVYEVSVTGPFDATGPGDTPSRRRIFTCTPAGPQDEEACAARILSGLTRRAYRRPIGESDLQAPLELFRQGRAEGGSDAGIELALSAILVNPQFLFRIERDPAGLPPGTPYDVSDLELASRLSFFLWSSIPDDELLEVAEKGELREPEVLDRQVRRMLADERSKSLVTNFAGQWLYLRNLESVTPDMRLYPDFDDNLRQAFRRETELFFENVLREDRSVLDLLDADFTFLDERLAKHYGVPHVYGSRFRRVPLDEQSRRGGLLRQGSILTVTSYATRTSPVLRGHWVLKNLVGTPPPPPPPNVPALDDNTVAASLPLRERLAQHREDPACAVCHNAMDPVGFSLENFDAVGRWRELESGLPVDASGGLPDGSKFTGPAGLEQALLARPDLFVTTLTERLLTFALGRGVEHDDASAVRKIVRDATADGYRFSSVIVGIVESTPFRMRTTQ